MNSDDKLTVFIVLTFISIFCFSFGIAKLTQPATGWIFAGCGYGCFTFVIFWFNEYLNKGDG